MINFTSSQGQQFRIWWSYFIPRPNGAHEATTCSIESTDRAVLYESTVTRHSSDRDDKEKARKASLKKVLGENFGKDDREKAWDAYFNR